MAFQTRALYEYNRASTMQRNIDLEELPLLTHYLNEVSALSKGTLTIVDYGCSEGFNSLILLSKVIREFRKNSNQPISILHDDLPGNNWVTFFETINNSPESYLALDNVFYSAVGRSFYNQLCVSNSVHLAYSGFAFHFFSKKPENSNNQLGVYPSAIEQLMQDLRINLTQRINELAVGGILITNFPGRFTEENSKYENLAILPVKALFEKGIITEQEYSRFCISWTRLNKEELERVLENFHGKIEILHLEFVSKSFAQYSEFLIDDDKERYIGRIENFIRVFIRNMVMIMLENRSQDEQEEIFRLCMEECRRTIDLEDIQMDFITLVFKKLEDL